MHFQFLHMSSSYWNFFVKELKIPNPYNTVLSVLKWKLKNYLLSIQNSGNPNQWNCHNLFARKLILSKNLFNQNTTNENA